MRLVFLPVISHHVHDRRSLSSLRPSKTCRALSFQQPAGSRVCDITNRLPPNKVWFFSLFIAVFIAEVGCFVLGK